MEERRTDFGLSFPKLKEEVNGISQDLKQWQEFIASQTLSNLARGPQRRTTFKEEESSGDEHGRSAATTAVTKAGDEVVEIAEALEALNCDKKRITEEDASVSQSEVEADNSQPKPKKRRRRRHEITRNFKCGVNGCTKSYGSEGALKTHIRLKHSEAAIQRKKEALLSSQQWPVSHTAGGVILPKPTHLYAGETAGAMPTIFQQHSVVKPPVISTKEGEMVESLKLPPLPTNVEQRYAGFQELPSFRHFFNSVQ